MIKRKSVILIRYSINEIPLSDLLFLILVLIFLKSEIPGNIDDQPDLFLRMIFRIASHLDPGQIR